MPHPPKDQQLASPPQRQRTLHMFAAGSVASTFVKNRLDSPHLQAAAADRMQPQRQGPKAHDSDAPAGFENCVDIGEVHGG
jgi:hypothetical protein